MRSIKLMLATAALFGGLFHATFSFALDYTYTQYCSSTACTYRCVGGYAYQGGTCVVACGDGVIEDWLGEQCDDGAANNGNWPKCCSTTCTKNAGCIQACPAGQGNRGGCPDGECMGGLNSCAQCAQF
jgi:hypothetical protein